MLWVSGPYQVPEQCRDEFAALHRATRTLPLKWHFHLKLIFNFVKLKELRLYRTVFVVGTQFLVGIVIDQ